MKRFVLVLAVLVSCTGYENTQCDDNQHQEDGCVDNVKEVSCVASSVEHSTNVDSQVQITWQSGNWSDAVKCGFNCNDGYYKDGDTCVENSECTGIIENDACRCEAGIWWELDFANDPTAINANLDQMPDWILRDKSTFDTSELQNGVWKTTSILDTTPHFDFNQSTSIHLKFRNVTTGGKGAVFWINGDFTETSFASIYASLTLQEDNTQTLTLFTKTDSEEKELASYVNLPTTFIDLWLSLDVEKDQVSVWVENQFMGHYEYSTRSASSEDRFASILGWGSEAEFDFIRIESCADGATHPEVVDTTPPVITLKGDNPAHIIVNSTYTEAGATANDDIDGAVEVTFTGVVDATQVGEYTLTYSAKDKANNQASVERKVIVEPDPSVECGSEQVRCVGSGKEYTMIQSAIDASSNGDTIMIFSGTYHEQIRVSKNVIIRAVQHNNAVIDGSKAVTSWQYDNSKQLYYADSPCEDVQALFINGSEKKAARYPNDGYLNISDATSKTRFSLENFTLNNSDIASSMAHVRMSHWRLSSRRVTRFENQYINLASEVDADDRNITSDFKVFFTQVLGAIDENTEWAWNNNKIYMKSPDAPKDVTVACSDFGIYLEETATNVEISGLQITKIKGHGITKKKDTRTLPTDDILIKNNTISYVSGRAIVIRDFFKQSERLPADTIIQGNEIHHARTGGIEIFADNALIDGNYIHDIGASKYDDDILSAGDSNMLTGIYLNNSSGARISNNRLHNLGYNGISISNGWAGWMSSGDRIVERNYITNAMLALNDGACIYTYTNKIDYINAGVEPERDIIRDNIMENCIGSFAGTNQNRHRQGEGIYLDDLSSHTDVLRNTVIGATKSLYLHNSFEVNVKDNTFVSPDSLSVFLGQAGKGGADRENVFLLNNNIHSADAFTYRLLFNHGQKYLTDSDKNTIRVAAGSEVKIGKGYSNAPNITFGQWKSYGFDDESLIIKDSAKPIILINPSTKDVTFSNLGACKNFDNTSLNANDVTVSPYQSKVVFGCDSYPPGTYSASIAP